MEKRYICFTCYGFHPERKGISEEEFKAGDNVCYDPKCTNKGKPLEMALRCEQCQVLYKPNNKHRHKPNTSSLQKNVTPTSNLSNKYSL